MRDGSSVEYTHSPFGAVGDRITDADGETVSESMTEYTSTGAVRSVTLDGVTVSYTYDSLGNVINEIEGEVVKTYTYDTRGRKSGYTLTVGGEEKSSAVYAYDKLDRLVSVTEGGITTTYTYDKNGNRIGQTTDTVTATYTYNKGNLVTSLVNSLNGEVISAFAYNYYADGNVRTKVESINGAETVVSYIYDGMGRLVSEMRGGVVIFYEYDANNNRVKMTNDGVVTTYTYDANNRLLSENTGDESIVYTYGDNGNMLAKKYPHSFTDGVCTICGEAETYMIGDTNLDGEISILDSIRILKIAKGELDGSDFSEDVTMLVYDVDGNGVIDNIDAEAVLQHNVDTRAITDIGTVVENTTDCVNDTYTYNARGQQIGYISSTANASYAYNPSGLRSAKTVGGSTKYFVYNGAQIVFEYDDAGETLYYYGLNRTHNSNGEIYVYNAHGDTVQLVKDGAVTVTYTYDAFGNLISQVGESDNSFKYCSEYFDEETQTYYLRARYYNPANGRFTQQDAWAFIDTSDPLSLNLYTYCSNNPVIYVDPSGHCAYCVIGIISTANYVVNKFKENVRTIKILTSYDYNWTGEYVTTEFMVKTYEISSKLEVNPDYLMGVMAFESWIDPTRVNAIGATGLIQFMPNTATSLGTTTDALAQMTAVEQLDYVYEFLKSKTGKMETLSDVYMAVLWPAAVGKNEEYVLWNNGTKAYSQNNGLDINRDGQITKSEATQKVVDRMEYYGERTKND